MDRPLGIQSDTDSCLRMIVVGLLRIVGTATDYKECTMRCSFLLIVLSASALYAQDAPPALTVYNQDFAVVRELIPLNLKSGLNSVRFAGVTARLEPESVALRDCAGGQTPRIFEQNYHPPVSQQDMMTRYSGQTIEFLVRDGDRQQIVSGKIIRPGSIYNVALQRRYGENFYPGGYCNPQMSPEQQGLEQPLVEVNSKLQFALPGTPLFPATSDESIFHPEINWVLDSDRSGGTRCELSYVTRGMTWEADYSVIAPAASHGNAARNTGGERSESLDLLGWVTLDNHSGRTFEDARVKLMAGDVHKIQPGQPMTGPVAGLGGGLLRLGGAGQPMVTEKAFDEYHLYTLERPTTLRDNETKQVEFLRRSGIPSHRVYVYSGFTFHPDPTMNYQPDYLRFERWFGTTSNPKVWVMQEIENSENNKLGIPYRAVACDFIGKMSLVSWNSLAKILLITHRVVRRYACRLAMPLTCPVSVGAPISRLTICAKAPMNPLRLG